MAQFPEEQSDSGEFDRQEDAFRQWVMADGSSEFAAEPDRYHLYVSLACPWAHRTLIVRHLLGLEEVIGRTVVDPVRDARGWAFRTNGKMDRDPINGFAFLSEAYFASAPEFQGRFTVPVLWDKKTHKIVNNSEDDICQMFATAFKPLQKTRIDLFPADHQTEQTQISQLLYEKVNNGVYRAGFASRQEAYEQAARELFAALDFLEERLTSRRYLVGDTFTEADWRFFCTLIRFDAVYHGHFKCNVRRIVDYPALFGYLQDLYQQPGIASTVNFDHIKKHYYITHDDINPTRIVPIGPDLDALTGDHRRDLLNFPNTE